MKITKKLQTIVAPQSSTRLALHGLSLALFLAGTSLASAITPQIVEYSAGISPSAFPAYITAGPDGNLWFTEVNANKIGRITTDGVVTEFTAGITPFSGPTGITAGPDGNMWFTEQADSNGNFGGRIGRITPDGVVTEFQGGLVSPEVPFGITSGPDGNLWFTVTEFTGSHSLGKIGRITTAYPLISLSGIVLMLLGTTLRWVAILTLRNYFTVTGCSVEKIRQRITAVGGGASVRASRRQKGGGSTEAARGDARPTVTNTAAKNVFYKVKSLNN